MHIRFPNFPINCSPLGHSLLHIVYSRYGARLQRHVPLSTLLSMFTPSPPLFFFEVMSRPDFLATSPIWREGLTDSPSFRKENRLCGNFFPY